MAMQTNLHESILVKCDQVHSKGLIQLAVVFSNFMHVYPGLHVMSSKNDT